MPDVRVTAFASRAEFMRQMVRERVAEFGRAFLSGHHSNPLMAERIAGDLGLHCRYLRNKDRYEFSATPFPQPVGAEKHLWRVMR